MIESFAVGDASLTYVVRGRGRGLLVPWCNFPWPEMPFVSALAERFTVVMASPRGYQNSTRLPASREYSAELLVNDLLAVCDHAGLETFSILGYSLTAAMAGWLASACPRVETAILGGFPLLGSYQAVLRDAEARAAEMTRDQGAAEAQRARLRCSRHARVLSRTGRASRRRARRYRDSRPGVLGDQRRGSPVVRHNRGLGRRVGRSRRRDDDT